MSLGLLSLGWIQAKLADMNKTLEESDLDIEYE